tara:strand:- start:639 stop:1178 length:540 start_codon:yes stop_codon:yes gene_type:complete
MFVFATIAILSLLLFAYICYNNRVEAIQQDDHETWLYIRDAKQEMFDFIRSENYEWTRLPGDTTLTRVQYYREVYTLIHEWDKHLFNFLQQNPCYIRDFWLVDPDQMYVDYEMQTPSHDAQKHANGIMKDFRDNAYYDRQDEEYHHLNLTHHYLTPNIYYPTAREWETNRLNYWNTHRS